eukprot:gene1178-3736_t
MHLAGGLCITTLMRGAGSFPGTEYKPAFDGHGLPLALADAATGSTLVMSPAKSFVTSLFALTADGVASGIAGSVARIPKGHVLSTAIALDRGVAAAHMLWGEVMLALGGKHRVRADATDVISSLGYSTTGFYFYDTLPGRSYQDTVLAVREYAERVGLPYKHYLLDSFWYGQY